MRGLTWRYLVAIFATTVLASASGEEVVVKVEDELGNFVRSEIFVIHSGGEKKYLKLYPGPGWFDIDYECKPSERLMADPQDHNYFNSEESDCESRMTLFVKVRRPVGADVYFYDPSGDDRGPGEYVYPTDAVYSHGSFDLTALAAAVKGNSVSFEVSVNAKLEDPWAMGVGFATQMIFIFIDNEAGGYTTGIPGTNVQFAESDAWDKCIIISPLSATRVKQEIEAKASDLAGDIVIPMRTTGRDRTITAKVRLADLGAGDPATWGYQVIMQSNDAFPATEDLLTRKVNEFEGQHRFGGGTDYDCDPHVIDLLGDHAMLEYECNADGSPGKMATLRMVRSRS